MRILTRGDLDGMTSSVLLTIAEKITDIRFAHPKDVQDGKVPCTADDIVVNLPFVPGCGMWFDHHVSEAQKLGNIGTFKGAFKVAPSAARVVYDHYPKHRATFDKHTDLLLATDKLDAAQLTMEDVTKPAGWILLGYTLDPRSGLGPEFQKYFRWLVEYVKEVPVAKILEHPEVKKRAERVRSEDAECVTFLKKHARCEKGVIVTDLRNAGKAPVANRFLIYTLFPEGHVEMRIFKGHQGATVVAAGHSIFNRTCNVNIGDLCARHGGGGHRGAGTCQLAADRAEAGVAEILKTLQANQG
jgi:nanoRNase/pAp phosphatase (c-di-AMP/oligoRNAs hydrolase)